MDILKGEHKSCHLLVGVAAGISGHPQARLASGMDQTAAQNVRTEKLTSPEGGD